MPFHFAVHPWIVINENGVITRYEIIHKEYQGKSRDGYLYKNFYEQPDQGILKSPFHSSHWTSRLLGEISGDENSLAHEVVNFIKENNSKYPFKNTYHLLGPNSNTYISWILKHFPGISIRLPWNAVGKDYL